MNIVETERNVCYAKHENEINVTLNVRTFYILIESLLNLQLLIYKDICV